MPSERELPGQMTTEEHEREEFSARGILRLRHAIPKKSVEEARRAVFTELARLKLKVGSKLSPRLQGLPTFQQTVQLGQMVKIGPEIEALFSKNLLVAMGDLASLSCAPTRGQPQLLLTFPQRQEWSTSELSWHLDLEVPSADEVPGVQAFVLIDDVQPRGGATLALAGSHRLHSTKEAAGNAHSLLRRHASIEDFTRAHGTSLVEMSGRAGDVYLMDMRVLHSPSVNASRHIRMMAALRLLRPGR